VLKEETKEGAAESNTRGNKPKPGGPPQKIRRYPLEWEIARDFTVPGERWYRLKPRKLRKQMIEVKGGSDRRVAVLS